MNNEKFNNYDVFHAFLVENADFDGYIELPIIKTSDKRLFFLVFMITGLLTYT